MGYMMYMIFNNLNIIPYVVITKINNIPRNIFVFIIAKTSRALDNFLDKTCVIVKIPITKIE